MVKNQDLRDKLLQDNEPQPVKATTGPYVYAKVLTRIPYKGADGEFGSSVIRLPGDVIKLRVRTAQHYEASNFVEILSPDKWPGVEIDSKAEA